MCGIIGYWVEAINAEEMGTITRRMSATLHHRGPMVFSILNPYGKGGRNIYLVVAIGKITCGIY
jgi:asparagine synthetase B (glutamine-hydrolysing)